MAFFLSVNRMFRYFFRRYEKHEEKVPLKNKVAHETCQLNSINLKNPSEGD